MKTLWTNGLKPEQKTEIKKDFISSAHLRNRLKDIIQKEIEANRSSSRNSNTYESPSWALMQADSIGYERALFKIISWISEDIVKKEEKN